MGSGSTGAAAAPGDVVEAAGGTGPSLASRDEHERAGAAQGGGAAGAPVRALPDARLLRGLVGLLAGAGVLHFLVPRPYDTIVPRWLPGRARRWTQASGLAELACAVAIAVPRSRRIGAAAAAALLVGVFPANLQMAWDWRGRGPVARLVAFGRLPLQVPLVLWALAVRRSSAQG